MGEAPLPEPPQNPPSGDGDRTLDSMSHEELVRLVEAEREARRTVEHRLESVLRDGRAARASTALRDYVMASAHCLLWYSDIYETNKQYLFWKMEFPNILTARNFLPIEIRKGEDLKAAWYNRRHADDRDACDVLGTAAVRAGRSYQQEFRCYCEDGSVRWLHEDVRVETIAAGKQWRAVGVCTDITAQRQLQTSMQQTNERLRRSVAETHHRVKNNLQVVASLVDMQTSDGSQPAEAQSAFQRMSQHIHVMAAIHDLLTHEARAGSDNDTVSLRGVSEKLVTLIRQTVTNRRIKAKVANVHLPSQQVTALVVLINELLSNSIRHARGDVELKVELQNGFVRLDVSDKGPGFPPDFDPVVSAKTGLEIVESIGRWDLQGRIGYETLPEGGGRVTLEFLPGTTHSGGSERS